MQRMLEASARLALGLWIGAVACVSFIVAPRVFRFLDDNEKAGELMRGIFPRVDYAGIVAALICVVALRRSRARAVGAALLGGLAAVNAFAVTPKIVSGAENLEVYHRLAVWIWGAILVGGAALIVAGAPPRWTRE